MAITIDTFSRHHFSRLGLATLSLAVTPLRVYAQHEGDPGASL